MDVSMNAAAFLQLRCTSLSMKCIQLKCNYQLSERTVLFHAQNEGHKGEEVAASFMAQCLMVPKGVMAKDK